MIHNILSEGEVVCERQHERTREHLAGDLVMVLWYLPFLIPTDKQSGRMATVDAQGFDS